MNESGDARAIKGLLSAVVVFLAGVALKLAQPVIISLLLTVLLVYLIDPLVVFLQRRRLPLSLSAFIAISFSAALLLGLGIMIFIDLAEFGRSFPRFQEELFSRAQAIMENLERSMGISFAVNPFEELRALPIGSFVLSSARSVLRILSEFLLILFFAVILLLGKYRVIRMVLKVFPRKHSLIPIVLRHIDRHLRMFLGIKTLSSLAVGIGTGALLLALGVQFAVTWGFLAFLLNFVPTLGPIASILMPVLISFVQFDGALRPIAIAAALGLMHVGISNVIEPRFMGERLNLSFFVIFLSLFFWGWLWGPAGVLLGVPVTASIKIILERIPATAHIALLLGKTESTRRRRARWEKRLAETSPEKSPPR